MNNFLNKFTSILDIIILISIIIYTALFFLDINIPAFPNSYIFLSGFALVIKIIFLKLSKEKLYKLLNHFVACILIYIAPSYYIIQYPHLIVSNQIIKLTLILVSILVFCGILIERFSNIIYSSNY